MMLNIENNLVLKIVDQEDKQFIKILYSKETKYLPVALQDKINTIASYAASDFGVMLAIEYPALSVIESKYPRLITDDEINTIFDKTDYKIEVLRHGSDLVLFVLNETTSSFGFISLK